jgi:hypothetical protein
VTTNPSLIDKLKALRTPVAAVSVVLAAVVTMLSQRSGLWPLAALVIVLTELSELWPARPRAKLRGKNLGSYLLMKAPALLVGTGVALIIALTPRLITQVSAAVLYAAWRIWWSNVRIDSSSGLAGLLVVQGVMFEAIFLMAAIWRTTPSGVVMAAVWAGSYLSVYSVLHRRGERGASVMAATWALVTTEISWVLLLWLFVYTATGGYVLVPQPALILTALAYCFGNIYLAQRQGSLSRARLTEYLLIGLILITIVITGTPWRGSI